MFIPFEPGDATHYTVGLDHIRHNDLEAFPEKFGACVFTFGAGIDKLRTGVFPSAPNFDLYYTRMWSQLANKASPTDLYTLVAGLIVVRHIMHADTPPNVTLARQIQERWDKSGYTQPWRDQLKKLDRVALLHGER